MFKSIGILIKIRPYLDKVILRNLYFTFVYTYLIYCVEVWGNACDTHLDACTQLLLTKNIIPHMRKLANIIPIPKPNKDTNMGTSYRPISLLLIVVKTLDKCLLPYITANITQTPTQRGYKAL